MTFAFSTTAPGVVCSTGIIRAPAAAGIVAGVLALQRARIVGSLLLTVGGLCVGGLAVAVWVHQGPAESSVVLSAPCYPQDLSFLLTINSVPAVASAMTSIGVLAAGLRRQRGCANGGRGPN